MNDILKKRIEEAELAFADKEYEVGEIDHDALCKGFFHGASYALSHQWINVEDALPVENAAEPLIVYAEIDTGDEAVHCVFIAQYYAKRFSCESKLVRVFAWMPIPEFEMKK